MGDTALHTVALVQARDAGPGRVYYQRKLSEGKTPAEARRALKRRLTNVLYRHLTKDQLKLATGGLTHRGALEPLPALGRHPGLGRPNESHTTSVGSRIESDSPGASTEAWPGHGRRSMKQVAELSAPRSVESAAFLAQDARGPGQPGLSVRSPQWVITPTLTTGTNATTAYKSADVQWTHRGPVSADPLAWGGCALTTAAPTAQSIVWSGLMRMPGGSTGRRAGPSRSHAVRQVSSPASNSSLDSTTTLVSTTRAEDSITVSSAPIEREMSDQTCASGWRSVR